MGRLEEKGNSQYLISMGAGGEDPQLKGYTENDTNSFYFIAGINVVVLAVVMMAASGGFAVAPAGGQKNVDKSIFSYVTDWRSQWSAGQRPFKDNTDLKNLAEADKKKVIGALHTCFGHTSGEGKTTKDDGNQDIKLTYLDALEALQRSADAEELGPEEKKAFLKELKATSLEEFKVALNDDELYTRITAHLRASRAEILDVWPLVFLAVCFGVAMLGIFVNYAQTSADEVVNQAAEDEQAPSPSKSPSKSPRKL